VSGLRSQDGASGVKTGTRRGWLGWRMSKDGQVSQQSAVADENEEGDVNKVDDGNRQEIKAPSSSVVRLEN